MGAGASSNPDTGASSETPEGESAGRELTPLWRDRLIQDVKQLLTDTEMDGMEDVLQHLSKKHGELFVEEHRVR
jgi:phosphoglycolate phosphatase-like HAD superfamily hydrolase